MGRHAVDRPVLDISSIRIQIILTGQECTKPITSLVVTDLVYELKCPPRVSARPDSERSWLEGQYAERNR